MSNLPVPVPPRLPAPASTVGGILGWLVTQYGFDALMEWLQDRRLNAPDVIDCEYQGPQVPTNPRTCAPDPCWDPVEAAEFKEMEDAARCGCDEDW